MRWPQTPQLRHAVLLPSRRCVPGSCERRGLHEVAQILVGELVRPSPCSIPDAEKVRQLLHPVLHQAPGQVVSELGECAVATEVEAIGGEECIYLFMHLSIYLSILLFMYLSIQQQKNEIEGMANLGGHSVAADC